MRWRGRRLPEVWFLLAAGLCLLAAVGVDVSYYAVARHPGRGAQAANVRYPLPSITGVLEVRDRLYAMERAGDPCKGLGRLDGIIGGTPIVVKDEGGAVVATGALDIGRVAQGSTCAYRFVVQGVPKADVYEFDVLGFKSGTLSYDDVVADGWQVTLSLP